MNKVIAREYVEKNYIKKIDLSKFVNDELEAIKECKCKDKTTARQFQLDGMEAVYKGIKNIFLEETK